GLPSARGEPFLLQPADLEHPLRERQPHHAAAQADGVESADAADAPVALQDAIAQIARARAQPPFVDAGVRAEGPAAPRDRAFAPAAHWGKIAGVSWQLAGGTSRSAANGQLSTANSDWCATCSAITGKKEACDGKRLSRETSIRPESRA